MINLCFIYKFIVDNSLKVRFKDTETQLKARDVIENTLGEGYITALNLLADSPEWMAKIKANPMFLGLDLRGGVHFTMQVDMKAAMQKTFERYSGDIRRELRREKIRTGTVHQTENGLTVPLQDAADVQKALPQLQKLFPEATLLPDGNNIVLTLSEEAINKVRSDAVKQNINTLHNRVNELGVAEPVIQQSGLDRYYRSYCDFGSAYGGRRSDQTARSFERQCADRLRIAVKRWRSSGNYLGQQTS